MKKRKRKKTHKISSKVVYMPPRADIKENISEKNDFIQTEKDVDIQDSLESEKIYTGLLGSAQRMLQGHQESLVLCRRSALKHAAWKSDDFEKDLIEIKLYLSKIEQDIKRIENSNNLVQFARKLDSLVSHKKTTK